MAAKKPATKKDAEQKHPESKEKVGKKHDCKLPEVCDYLAELSDYLKNTLIPDYIRLRKAVCHLERVVLDGKPPNSALRFCSGAGGGSEPPDPPPPPEW